MVRTEILPPPPHSVCSVFSVPVIAGNCGQSPGSGRQVSRKRGEQDVLIELGKLKAGLSWAGARAGGKE